MNWITNCLAATGVLMLLVGIAQGGDLVTLSGTVYHDAEPLHADIDGVTYRYDEGEAKIDFTDLPPSVRQAYHYDPVKAAAYRDMQLKAREQADAKKLQILKDDDERRRARLQAEAAAALERVSSGADTIFRRAASPAASEATKALGAQVAAAVGKPAVTVPASKTIIELRKIESTLISLGIIHFSHPAEVDYADEFKTNLHHAPSDSASGGVQDSFNTPIYLSKSYYEDVDRSTALLSNEPAKP